MATLSPRHPLSVLIPLLLTGVCIVCSLAIFVAAQPHLTLAWARALSTPTASPDALSEDEPEDEEPLPLPASTPTPTPNFEAAPSEAEPRPMPPRRPPASPTPAPTPPLYLIVPILMYHHIADAPLDADAVRLDLSVSPAAFEEQLRYLKQAGFRSMRLVDLAEHFRSGTPLPAKPVILTFDDGYDDAYSHAYRLLKQYDFTGTFFIPTGLVGKPGYLTWEQIVEMHGGGMEMGGHTRSHVNLRTLPQSSIVGEVVGSQQDLQAYLHQPVQVFAYPSGRYDARVIQVLRSAGFQIAVTTRAGVVHSSAQPFELRRVRVRGEYTLDKFVEELNAWLTLKYR